MPFDSAHLLPILPEVTILVTAGTVLLADLYKEGHDEGRSHGLTLLGLLVAFGLTGLVGGGERTVVFDGNVVRDAMSDLLKGAILVVSALAFIYARPWLRDRQLLLGEFYVLGLCAVLGMLVMVSANSLLTLYLGLELQALSMYALVAFDRDSKSGPEAAMKYFVLGSLGSGMLLYGASMIYGATGSIELGAVAQAVATPGSMTTVLVFGIAFLVIGIGFKFAAVPFHMWLPDTYEGSPTPVALILSSAPKIAAFALAVRLLVEGLGALQSDWQGMLVILAVLSIVLGNVVAIAQTNIKRMLGYSTISHVGFVFLGLIAGSAQGYAAAMFYIIIYAVTSAGTFGMLALLSREGFDAEKIEDLKGLNDRDPWYAAMMALMMFSLAGVPPTVTVAPSTNPVPVIVTGVPPVAGPDAGVMPVVAGPGL
jgi:NADH-quinone oxidoreductase subunit N